MSPVFIGELNASHTGVSGPSSVTLDRGPATRYLGFEMEPAGARYRVSHIYRADPDIPDELSPLARAVPG